MQKFASPNIVTAAHGIVLIAVKNSGYYIIMLHKYEVIENAISEALMLDHSVAIKHFVRRIWEVLSTMLIQLARLISS